MWGGAKNYLGFNKHGFGNFYLYPDASEPTLGLGLPAPLKTGFSPYCYLAAGVAVLGAVQRDSSVNCTCVAMAPKSLYSQGGCDPANTTNGQVPLLANNTYYIDAGDYAFPCNASSPWDLKTAQANGVDVGTEQLPSPDTEALLQLVVAFAEAQLMQ